MSYTPVENMLGIQPLAVSSATKNHDLGAIIRARDPVYGQGEFIYLLGVASTVVGSVVTWGGNASGTPTDQTALAPATAHLAQPVAVAMSANLASSFGWYQIGGNAVVATNGTVTAGVPLGLAGSGQLTATVAAGMEVLNAVSVTANGTPAAGQTVVQINRPFAQGQIL